MPSLLAIISADANPMKRELLAVQRMSAQTGSSIQTGLAGGFGGSGSQSFREMIVVLREIISGRGLQARTAGSLMILAQKLGLLKFIIKDNVAASKLLADAWTLQAEKAGIASVAAVRKAGASLAAAEAEGFESDEANAVADSDERAAAAAILHQKATSAKAVASREAAAAQELESGAATAAVGPLGVVLGIVVALGAGFYASYKLGQHLIDVLSGLKPAEFHPEYIARHLQGVNQIAEAQKEINKEIDKTVEKYYSAASAAERVSKATSEHFEHLRKMNEYEKDPHKKAANELEINRQERAAQLANMIAEQSNLTLQGKAKQNEANKLLTGLPGEKNDEQNLSKAKKEAEEAQKFLNEMDRSPDMFTKQKAWRAYNKMAWTGVSDTDIVKGQKDAEDEAHRRIANIGKVTEQNYANEQLRKQAQDLIKESGGQLSQAAALALAIKAQPKINATKDADEAAESAAKLASEKGGFKHGPVNEMQKIGAYASQAYDQGLVIARKSEHHLKVIADHVTKQGGYGSMLGRSLTMDTFGGTR